MLVLGCLCITLGIALYQVGGLGLVDVALIAGFVGGGVIGIFRTWRAVLLGAILGGAVMLGALRLWVEDTPDVVYGTQTITAVVKSVDDRFDRRRVIVIEEVTRARLQMTLFTQSTLSPGDRVSIRGRVEPPESFVTDVGRLFDYSAYLKSRRVDALISPVDVVVQGSTGNYGLERMTRNARLWVAETLKSYVTFPIDGVIGGMLIGYQGTIPPYVSDTFRDTGTLHTLVLSGYNITVVAGFIGVLLRRVSLRKKSFGILLGIIALVLVSGSGVAAVRAGIMGIVALLATATLEDYSAWRALLYAALLFFFVNPYTILFDPGFHLSFLATAFIVLILPLLTTRIVPTVLARYPGVRETFLLALGLPLFMLPYFMYFSGVFPLVTPIANILIAPCIPVLMFGGALVVAGAILPPLAGVIGVILSFVGNIVLSILSVLADTPQLSLPEISGVGIALVYGVFFAVIFWRTIVRVLVRIHRDLAPQTS